MAIYTNISEDHLDRHHSMKEYVKMKKDYQKILQKKILSYLIVMIDILMSIFNKTKFKTLKYGIKSLTTLFFQKQFYIS